MYVSLLYSWSDVGLVCVCVFIFPNKNEADSEGNRPLTNISFNSLDFFLSKPIAKTGQNSSFCRIIIKKLIVSSVVE